MALVPKGKLEYVLVEPMDLIQELEGCGVLREGSPEDPFFLWLKGGVRVKGEHVLGGPRLRSREVCA